MDDKPTTRVTNKVLQSRKIKPSVNVVRADPDLLLQPTEKAPAAAHRFEKYIVWVLRQSVTDLVPTQRTIACALAFEGLTNAEDLLKFLNAMSTLVKRGDAMHATWENQGGRIERRSVCAITAIAAASIKEENVSWEKELDNFGSTLRTVYPGGRDMRSSEVLKSFLFDATAWLYLKLPNVCYAHVCDMQHLNLLPDAVLDGQFGIRSVRGDSGVSVATFVIDPLAEFKDIATEISFNDGSNKQASTWVISALKNLVRDASDRDSVRTADYVSKATVRKRLDIIAATLTRGGTSVDALLFLWVIFLLESGSVRLRNPKIGTIARYVHAAVELLHGALNGLAVIPVNLEQEEWEVCFTQILEAEGVTGELRCALASFHHFLIGEFGIDSMPWLFIGVDENCVPNANHVWPSEIEGAYREVVKFTDDTRLRESICVMLAIGSGNKVRIGDVGSIRLCNIQVIKSSLEIQIAPRRSHHQGKSPAARRTLNYSESPERVRIEAWLARRIAESAEPNDLLFGDPHQSDKGYRLGACQRLLNQLLRAVTGDRTVSFHSLRHTLICNELLSALLAADIHQPISSVFRTAVEAGHRHQSTTFKNYFHRPEEPIRYWIDRALAEHLDSPAVAARWLDKSPEALRQGRHRANDKEHYLHGLVRAKALSHVSEVAPMLYEALPVTQSPDSVTTRPVAFDNLMRVISDISSGFAMPAICSRNSTDEENVVRMCHAIANTTAQLEMRRRKRFPLLARNANAQARLFFARDAITRHGFNFEVRAEPHLSGLVQLMEMAPTLNEELAKVAVSWIRCKHNDTISLADVEAAKPLVAILQAAALPADNLIIRIQVCDFDDQDVAQKALEREEVMSARSVIEQAYNSTVQIEFVRARRGRPDVYLVLSRKRLGLDKPGTSAGCRMNRFHGLMLVLAVWQLPNTGIIKGVRLEHA